MDTTPHSDLRQRINDLQGQAQAERVAPHLLIHRRKILSNQPPSERRSPPKNDKLALSFVNYFMQVDTIIKQYF